MMDYEKLIDDLRDLLDQYGEKIPYGELVCAEGGYGRAGDLVWTDPEPYYIEQSADAISALLAENARLKKYEDKCHDCPIVCAKTEVSKAYEEVERLKAENASLRKERDAAVEDLRKHRKYKCDCCHYGDKQSRFPCTDCQSPISTYGDGWKWRGPKED